MVALSNLLYVIYYALEFIIDAQVLQAQRVFALDYESVLLSFALVNRVVTFYNEFQFFRVEESQVAHIFLRKA